MFASFAGVFVDLRNADPRPDCLHPDPAIGYPAGNALADQVRNEGNNGIIYPSVRHDEGTCIVALWPTAVQLVAQGQILRDMGGDAHTCLVYLSLTLTAS